MAKDHLRLIAELHEICDRNLAKGALTCLYDEVVVLVARHLKADVCSIYLFEEKSQKLRLSATVGLKFDREKPVELGLSEGLVGRCLETRRPVVEKIGSRNPHFKAVPGIEEEKYDAYLAVPMLMGDTRIGVLMLQRGKNRHFLEKDVMAVRAVSSQLAYLIENARLHQSLQGQIGPDAPAGLSPGAAQASAAEARGGELRIISGRVACEGVAYGESRRWITRQVSEILADFGSQTRTIEDYEKAVEASQKQIEALERSVEKEVMDQGLAIFSGHLMILRDRLFHDRVRGSVKAGAHPARAVVETAEQFAKLFTQAGSQLVREKVHDLEDITRRVLHNLLGAKRVEGPLKGHIVIAETIFPSELLRIASEKAAGVLLVSGGVTSHVAILARSVRLPLMIVDDDRLLSVADGTPVLLDGEQHRVVFHPEKTLVHQRLKRSAPFFHWSSKGGETLTADGVRVEILANVNLLSDVKHGKEAKAEGIGLFRSEFLFLFRNTMPSEEEQVDIYRRILLEMDHRPVTLRTLDLGGDKLGHLYGNHRENNPALGLRSVRFTLQHRDLFLVQARAMLRAGVGHDLRIMFPMIGSIEEMNESRSVVRQAQQELAEEGLPYHEKPLLGSMIEVPSVVPILDDLAAQCDFFSIGTNDLVQYLLAVDRTNERVASWYLPHHPGVLRTLNEILVSCLRQRMKVSVCGDLAHESAFIPFLLGIGVRSLSLDADYIPRVREVVTKIKISQVEKEVKEILALSSVREIAYRMGFDYTPLSPES
jgi:phosphotransferase system enzyme I (PtsP)